MRESSSDGPRGEKKRPYSKAVVMSLYILWEPLLLIVFLKFAWEFFLEIGRKEVESCASGGDLV